MFTKSQLNLIAIGMQIAGERFEKDAMNRHMPVRLREQFAKQARQAYAIVDAAEDAAGAFVYED